MSDRQPFLDQLLTEDLSGVVFVRDYLQLQFNPNPTLDVYTACHVVSAGESASLGEPVFAKLAIAQIGKDVTKASERDGAVVVEFEDGSRFEVPLDADDLPGGQACVLSGREGGIASWPRARRRRMF